MKRPFLCAARRTGDLAVASCKSEFKKESAAVESAIQQKRYTKSKHRKDDFGTTTFHEFTKNPPLFIGHEVLEVY